MRPSRLLLLLLLPGLLGSDRGESLLRDPGVTLPPDPELPLPDEEAVALNNEAARVMWDDEEAALALFDQAIEIDANCYMAYTNKATLLIRQEKYQAAATALERATQLRPHAAEFYIPWAYCLHLLGDDDEAEEQLRHSIAAHNLRLADDPQEPWKITNRAVVVFLLGDKELSLQELDRVLEAQPEFKPAQLLQEEIQATAVSDRWDLLFD